MALMYDSINVANIPAGATDILAYTDGAYANEAAIRARFPNATIHTISAMGQVFAQWVDCEPGAVWPPSAAAAVVQAWQARGCKGIYASLNNMQACQEAVNALHLTGVEYFDANYTNVEHVDPGYVATQYADPGPYDETDTTATFEDGMTGDTDVIVIEDAAKTFIGLCGPMGVIPLESSEVAWANATFGGTVVGMPNTLITRINAQVASDLAANFAAVATEATANSAVSSVAAVTATVNTILADVAALKTAVAAIPTTSVPGPAGPAGATGPQGPAGALVAANVPIQITGSISTTG